MTSDDAKTVKVWRWADAPDELRRLSRHGGDEDWVVYVPAEVARSPEWAEWLPQWVKRTDTCLDPQEIKRRGGARVYIGAHA